LTALAYQCNAIAHSIAIKEDRWSGLNLPTNDSLKRRRQSRLTIKQRESERWPYAVRVSQVVAEDDEQSGKQHGFSRQ
jgi:hypothetical protein